MIIVAKDCVRREVAEEVGIEVESIEYKSSQHWPFPAGSLMIGGTRQSGEMFTSLFRLSGCCCRRSSHS